jgi:hypothetical protein
MISNVAAQVAAYPARLRGSERTATDVIMALTCSDVFPRTWTDILKSLF